MARISISLKQDLVDRLDHEARKEGTTRCNLIEKAVMDYLEAKRQVPDEGEKRKRIQEACRRMDELAKRLGHWDPVAIIRRFRDTNLKG